MQHAQSSNEAEWRERRRELEAAHEAHATEWRRERAALASERDMALAQLEALCNHGPELAVGPAAAPDAGEVCVRNALQARCAYTVRQRFALHCDSDLSGFMLILVCSTSWRCV